MYRATFGYTWHRKPSTSQPCNSVLPQLMCTQHLSLARNAQARSSAKQAPGAVVESVSAPGSADDSISQSFGVPPAAGKYNWTFEISAQRKPVRNIVELPVELIKRPLGKTRGNDQEKVAALMESIQDIGLQEPIDVLLVEGVYYGFSGCHRYEAHQKLGLPTIKCRVRKANREVLRMHMM